MSPQSIYRINKPKVIHEVFEDEVVIVNLGDGVYYSLDRVGAVIWNSINDGAPESEMVARLTRQFESNGVDLDSEVRRLLKELQDEDLIVQCADDSPSVAPQTDDRSLGVVVPKQKFAPPVLARYTDMKDILLLDPIHEVDETGWPSKLDTAVEEKKGS